MTSQIELSPGEVDYYELFTPLTRDFKPTDLAFVTKTWMRVYIQEQTNCSRERYYRKMQVRIKRVCTHPDTRISIVCDEAHQDFVVGFTIVERAPHDATKPLVLHFAFTRRPYRQQGIFKMMLKDLQYFDERKILTTHWTRALYPLRSKYKLEYDPFFYEGIKDPDDYDKEGEW